jgi:hypothetical protein
MPIGHMKPYQSNKVSIGLISVGVGIAFGIVVSYPLFLPKLISQEVPCIVGVPLPIILKGLSILAAPTGCGDVVNMKGFDQLRDIGSLSSLTNLLP